SPDDCKYLGRTWGGRFRCRQRVLGTRLPSCRGSQVVLHEKYTGASLHFVSVATGHRVRWIAVWVLVVAWFVAQAVNVGGNAVHLILLVAIGLLVYELLAEDARRLSWPCARRELPADVAALRGPIRSGDDP